MIFFVDKKLKEKLGPKTGCNQTGIFVSHSEIIFVRKRKVQKINVDELKGTKVAIHKVADGSLSRNIVAFFKNIKDNYRMFGLGIRALANHNFEVFDSENIMPKFENYSSIAQYDIAWSELTSKLRKGDLIFTFNKKVESANSSLRSTMVLGATVEFIWGKGISLKLFLKAELLEILKLIRT